MSEIHVSIFAESMSVYGVKKETLIRYAEMHYLDWYVKGKLFYFSGKPTCLYKVLVDLTATATLIVD